MALDAQFQYDDLNRLVTSLTVAGRQTAGEMKKLHTRMGATVKDRAALYAPKSPTDAERRSVSKATKKQWAAAKKRRRSGATSRRKPGALQASIDFLATSSIAEVFVPTNSPAGAYAYKMHEERGITWQNRGIGTKKKGPKSRENYIERAIVDTDWEMVTLIERTANELAGKL